MEISPYNEEQMREFEAAYWSYLKEVFDNPEVAERARKLFNKIKEEEEAKKYPNRWKRNIKDLILG